MDGFARGVYAVFGWLAILAGVAVLVQPSLLIRPGDPAVVAHLLREEAAAFVFIGLMFLWARRHFSSRRPVHFSFMVFTALFAAVHWIDFFDDAGRIWSPLLNTVPFLLLLLTTPRRRDVRRPARASL
jgi:hypothetical protein